jgi:hypothetical protein
MPIKTTYKKGYTRKDLEQGLHAGKKSERPAIHLHDKNFSVLVDGTDFAPNSQVNIFYSYNTDYGLTTNGMDPLISRMGPDGSLERAEKGLNEGTIEESVIPLCAAYGRRNMKMQDLQ